MFTPEKDKLPHHNHIEMTGLEASSIISYKVDEKKRLKLYSFCVFPQIRVIPNETRGSLSRRFKNAELYFANKDIKINKAQFSVTDIMDIDYSENGVKNQMRFNIRTGEMLIRLVIIHKKLYADL